MGRRCMSRIGSASNGSDDTQGYAERFLRRTASMLGQSVHGKRLTISEPGGHEYNTDMIPVPHPIRLVIA